jgi:hypothetical protein
LITGIVKPRGLPEAAKDHLDLYSRVVAEARARGGEPMLATALAG